MDAGRGPVSGSASLNQVQAMISVYVRFADTHQGKFVPKIC